MTPHYLQFDAITKSFPGVRALDRVSFGVAEGSVHALVGENGAGKSTLLKILSGVYRPDEGRLILGGQPRLFHSTSAAIDAGVAVIYQELYLVPELSVAENLHLGHLPHRVGWVNRRRLLEATRRQLAILDEALDPRAKVSSLSIAQRQMVEIAKALSRDAKVIAFDEPTSSLSSREIEKLFAVIRQLKLQGRVTLYVSHRMAEIFEVCDTATVLRDGRHVETFAALAPAGAGSQAAAPRDTGLPPVERATHDLLVQRMVGRSIADIFHYAQRQHGPAALEVDALMGPGLAAPASFAVARGEIVGFFGLVGAGRTELMKLIYGAVPATGGRVKVWGRPVRVTGPRSAIRQGIMLCPEDRKKEGVIPIRSVMENVNLSGRRNFARLGFFINERRERQNAQTHVAKLAIKTPSLAQLIMNLSGGNQQKVILARWLSETIEVMLLDEPTRGIDVGAKSEIYSIIYELARQQIGVVVVSSELPEVLGICDRILVMRQGRIVASLPRGEATQEQLLKLALPVTGGAGRDERNMAL
jgi:L-arabinose transport system ATP-binding protein